MRPRFSHKDGFSGGMGNISRFSSKKLDCLWYEKVVYIVWGSQTGCLRVVSVDVTNARGRLFPHGSCGCIARQTDGYPRFIRFPGNSSREIPFDRTPPCSDREEFVKTINLLRRRPFRHLKVKKLRTVISTGSNDFYFVSTDLREQNA